MPVYSARSCASSFRRCSESGCQVRRVLGATLAFDVIPSRCRRKKSTELNIAMNSSSFDVNWKARASYLRTKYRAELIDVAVERLLRGDVRESHYGIGVLARREFGDN